MQGKSKRAANTASLKLNGNRRKFRRVEQPRANPAVAKSPLTISEFLKRSSALQIIRTANGRTILAPKGFTFPHIEGENEEDKVYERVFLDMFDDNEMASKEENDSSGTCSDSDEDLNDGNNALPLYSMSPMSYYLD